MAACSKKILTSFYYLPYSSTCGPLASEHLLSRFPECARATGDIVADVAEVCKVAVHIADTCFMVNGSFYSMRIGGYACSEPTVHVRVSCNDIRFLHGLWGYLDWYVTKKW